MVPSLRKKTLSKKQKQKKSVAHQGGKEDTKQWSHGTPQPQENTLWPLSELCPLLPASQTPF